MINILKSYFVNNEKKILFLLCLLFFIAAQAQDIDKEIEKNGNKYDSRKEPAIYLNQKANGFRGIWYMVQPTKDMYRYKYSGGMAFYCEEHRPFAIFAPKVNKTFFCFGGTDEINSTLFHNVSFFDHKTGKIANPLSILNKQTTDAHDNPVISIDDKGYIYIFSTSHGIQRPSYISKSEEPYSIEKFNQLHPTEIVDGKEVPFTNFSYFQVWYVKNKGFIAIFTKYDKKNHRVIGFNTSKDAVKWNEWKVLAHIEEGHYQISQESKGKIGVAFNYHPNKNGQGLDYRTNLYYIETTDFGKTWHNSDGNQINLPLTQIDNIAKVKNYKSENLNCYLKDLQFDHKNLPVILVISSKGFKPGPENDPRTWELFCFDKSWRNVKVTTSTNNYDTPAIFISGKKTWQILGPSDPGPQPYNPGGEIASWRSYDAGLTWTKEKKLTNGSERNHNYVRSIFKNGKKDFKAVWADGNGSTPSVSYLYYCDEEGNVFRLPRESNEDMIEAKKMIYQ